jgi:hypothetical protein
MEAVKLGLLTAKVTRKLISSLSDNLESIVSDHLKEKSSDPASICQWLEERFNSKRGENRIYLRKLYFARRRESGESWKECMDDFYNIYCRYVEAGAARDEIDLVSQAMTMLKEGKFTKTFVEKWEVKRSEDWKWDTFYADFTIYLVGKDDPKPKSKALGAVGEEKKHDYQRNQGKKKNMVTNCSFCGGKHENWN